MKIENLVKMANQIGDFYNSFPNQEDAKRDIAKHLVNFWASSMRQEILAHVNQHNGEGLSPIVNDAIKQYMTSL